jgi:glycerol kinase
MARAMVEAMAFQARDVLDAMAGTETVPTEVRVDGGAAVMDLLLQELADQSRLAVLRPASVETTAVGAATMAGLWVGLWQSLDELADLWREDAAFSPVAPAGEADRLHEGWQRSVERSRRWALADDQPTDGR